MGDPAGIGPELIVKLLKNNRFDLTDFIIFGSYEILQNELSKHNTNITVKKITSDKIVNSSTNTIQVFQTSEIYFNYNMGEINPNCGKLAYESIINAIDFAKKGIIKAIVTAPINKESLKLASIDLIGHTEILSQRTNSKDVFMLMVNDDIKVILCTIHVPLLKAILSLNQSLIYNTIKGANLACKHFGIERPKIGVSGLNPHAGENGTMGEEEEIFIKPAIADAINSGLDVVGPISPDVIYSMARQKKVDIVVSLYHDQGLIPFKYLGIGNGVNITIGLPFVRTSPDHGTAFEIAGKGIAKPDSFFKAVKCAQKMINK